MSATIADLVEPTVPVHARKRMSKKTIVLFLMRKVGPRGALIADAP